MNTKETIRRPELLAPAGNYEAFLGAIAAGADAVYLGGARFGARAYADNFDEEHVLRAITYAHLRGRKVYMTVNTLVKEQEYPDLYDFLKPYADAGLDGVIVQDFGVFVFIRANFPNVELHASTQMAVSGVYGAKMLKQMGATRVVPARELSLEEIRRIREEADIEVEAFIHGAMCYCYSGMCLFSSLVGGRSGNRGRCAQPCRLPYQLGQEKDFYPLSLKDMCTVEILPKLIGAGIDSFKIEGRMKRAEYVAGVTAIYRKYIDRFLADPQAPFAVEPQDMDLLRHLYLRTEISRGYYEKHNGKDMVTLTAPGYAGSDDALLARISEQFLKGEEPLPVTAQAYLHIGENAVLRLTCMGQTAEVTGAVVQEASKRPMAKEDIEKHLSKFGGSMFSLAKGSLMIDMEEGGNGIFCPIRDLNELRRQAAEELTLKMTSAR